MNIFFAEIRGLTLERQSPADLDPGQPPPPPGRFGESLDPDAATQRQAIEFNEFFNRLNAPGTIVDETVRALPDGAWREFLAHAPVQVTTDGEPALLRPAETVTPLRVMVAASGENLPVGGNSLPRPAPVLPPGAVVAQPANFPATPPLPVAAGNAGRAPIDADNPPAAVEMPNAPRGERSRLAGLADLPPQAADQRRDPAFVPRAANRATVRSQAPLPVAATARAPQPAAPAFPPPADAAPAGGIPSESVPASGASRLATAALASGAEPLPLPAHRDRDAAPRTPAAAGAAPRTPAAAPEPALANVPRSAAAAVPGLPETLVGDGLPPRGTDAPPPATAGSGPAPAIPATTAANAAALPPQLESLALPRQAGAADWANGLGERVSWMIDQRQNSATIRLDPPTLGKLDVQVRVADDATTITIQAQHAPTRELIEASATRLRDFLQESGFQNVNVDVSQRHDQQQARAQTAPDADERADGAPPEPDHPGSTPADRLTAGDGAGLIDTFA